MVSEGGSVDKIIHYDLWFSLLDSGLVAVDFQDFAGGVDFDLTLATVGGAVEFIDLAAVVGIGVMRRHGESGHARLGRGEDIGWNPGGLGRTRVALERLRGGTGGQGGHGGDEEQGFQCFHVFWFLLL